MSPKLKPETLAERKAQILKAALNCFARKGYHQTTMDDIVLEAGLSKGGVYWHFSSKKELFLLLFESIVADVGNSLSVAVDSEASATDKLCSMLDVLVTISTAEEFRDLFPLMIDVWAQNSQDPDVNEAAVAVYNHFRQPLVQLIEEGIASGEFRVVDAGALASILLALYDGLAVQWMIDETIVDWDAVSQTVKETFFAGLLAREPQP
jgi:AcrR family transcriptional regulator